VASNTEEASLNTKRSWVSMALALSCALVAAVGFGGSASSKSPTVAGGATTKAATLKIGLVTDIGGLNDKSFNFLANKGLQQAKSQLGVTVTVKESKGDADYVPNLQFFAAKKYDLVIAVGFLMGDATEKVAGKFPNVKFAIIDSSAAGMKSKPKNVEGLLFSEQEAGYLVGYLSGLYAKDNNVTTVGSVGGQKIPPVDHYIAGFQAGAKKADPSIKTLNAYSQDFVDQAKCKELALNQIAKGSKVEFQVAGQCGLGVLDAAKEKNVLGIGVDADQGYLGTQVMTSALKRVDVAVYSAIKAAKAGKLKGGTDATFGAKDNGVGYGKWSSKVPVSIRNAVAAQFKLLKAGKVTGIPSTVK
jgi:basic membrane protein A